MYGIVSVEREVNDQLLIYIERNYESLVSFADKQIRKFSNGASPLGGDLVNDMYMSFKVHMEDRDGVDTQLDACKVVHRYIAEAARGAKYKEGSEIGRGIERASYYDEEGNDRDDFAAPEKSEEECLLDFTAKDKELALYFMEDTFEDGSDRVESTVKVLVKLAEEMKVIEKENTDEAKTRMNTILAAVNSMAFKDASDDFKEAFRVIFASAISC